jgi:hypothetical protein
MSHINWLLRIPRWLERSWQETHVADPEDSQPPTMILEDTLPAELLASPDLRV